MNITGVTHSKPVVSLGFMLVVTLSVLAWTHQSGQQLLKNSTMLVDKVMQLRVELTQAHYQIHEGTEQEPQRSLDRAFILALIDKINASAAFLHGEELQMGRLSGHLSEHFMSTASINRLKDSLQYLSSYLEENHAILNHDAEEDNFHDQLFASAEMISEEIDEQVHEGVAISLEQQRNIFILLFAATFAVFAALLFLLRRSNQTQLLALRQATKLSQALEHSGEAAMIANRDGVIEFVNDAFCQMSGYTAEEAIGNNPNMLSSGKQNKPFYENLWATVTSGEVWQGELINRKRDGSLYPAMMTIAPIFDAGGLISHYVANQRDMTEYKALEKNLFQAQKMEAIGTLASGIAHDFNNALSGITGNLYLIHRAPDDKAKVIKRISAIQQICDSSAIHIKQLLSYARKDSVLMNAVELNQCVQNACRMVNAMLPDAIALKFISYDRELYVQWNETQIQQILINFINNARHALKGVENPNITLEIKIIDNSDALMRANQGMADKKYVCLSIKDNGCGMSKVVMDQIFDPFFTTKESDEGTGLGLSMAYGAVKQAGGTLIVDSEIGGGTMFQICLPIAFESHPEQELESEEICEGQGETVLLADDDRPQLQTQGDIISSFGYNVLIAGSGTEAVELFERHADEISVVILDLVMPGMTGLEAAKKILSRQPDAKIILATGCDQKDLSDDDINTLDSPVIFKPYKPAAMSRLIHEQIKKRVVRFNDD